jgi:undecaprenyl-diphosphatase
MVRIVAPFAATWILLVALSRLVLGVHWPSDVLTAACLGVIIPFIVQLILQRWRAR